MFVGNLSFETQSDELRGLFEPHGEVLDVSIPADRDNGRPRGFAFVEFATAEQAAAAIDKLNGFELAGRALRVNDAEERPSRPQSFGRAPAGAAFRPRPKGSRRNVRARKRSIW